MCNMASVIQEGCDMLFSLLFLAAVILTQVMDKELTITETMNCTSELAEVRPDLEVFWHLASHLLSCIKVYFIEREVLSEMLSSLAAKPVGPDALHTTGIF